MKVEVVPSYHDPKKFTVKVSQGVQSFRLDYTETKKQCEWMAKMFRKALKVHDEVRRFDVEVHLTVFPHSVQVQFYEGKGEERNRG